MEDGQIYSFGPYHLIINIEKTYDLKDGELTILLAEGEQEKNI